jgi:hypothetical protein
MNFSRRLGSDKQPAVDNPALPPQARAPAAHNEDRIGDRSRPRLRWNPAGRQGRSFDKQQQVST